MAITYVDTLPVQKSLFEQVNLEAEFNIEGEIEQVVGEDWIDDEEAQRLYIQELKNDNGSEVCGR